MFMVEAPREIFEGIFVSGSFLLFGELVVCTLCVN